MMKIKKIFLIFVMAFSFFSFTACNNNDNSVLDLRGTSMKTYDAYQMVLKTQRIEESNVQLCSTESVSANDYIVSIVTGEGVASYKVYLDEEIVAYLYNGDSEYVTQGLTADTALKNIMDLVGLKKAQIVYSNVTYFTKNDIHYLEVELVTNSVKYQFVYEVMSGKLDTTYIELLVNIPNYKFISKDEAKAIALNFFNANNKFSTNIEVKKGRKNNLNVYLVSYTYNDLDYDITIGARTGEIMMFEYRKSRKEMSYPVESRLKIIDMATAKKVLTDYFQDNNLLFSRFYLDLANCTYQYKVKFNYGNYSYLFAIDAITGKISGIKEYQLKDNDLPVIDFLTEEEALKVAYRSIGVYQPGTNCDIKVVPTKDSNDTDDYLNLMYVVLISTDGRDYTIELDAVTCFKISIKFNESLVVPNGYVSQEEALNNAIMSALYTADMVNVKFVKLVEVGRELYYEIKFIDKNTSREYHINIDAKTGKLLEFDWKDL